MGVSGDSGGVRDPGEAVVVARVLVRKQRRCSQMRLRATAGESHSNPVEIHRQIRQGARQIAFFKRREEFWFLSEPSSDPCWLNPKTFLLSQYGGGRSPTSGGEFWNLLC